MLINEEDSGKIFCVLYPKFVLTKKLVVKK